MADYELYHGDCLEVMPGIPSGSVDAIIADWPYGTTACKWDSIIPLEPLWKECKRVIKRNGAIVLFGSQPFTSMLVMSNLDWFKYEWIWDKVLSSEWHSGKYRPLLSHENILVFSNGTCANGGKLPMSYNPQMVKRDKPRSGTFGNDAEKYGNPKGRTRKPIEATLSHRYPKSIVVSSGANRTNQLHPTQKPLPLLEYLVKTYTNPGDVVLDNTFGSCTTGEACLRTGRQFIGIERDDNYFRIGQERMERVKVELSAMLPGFQQAAA